MDEARLWGPRQEAREIEPGQIMLRFRRYMSFSMELLMMILLLVERNMELCPSVDITPALSSWTLLMRLVQAAGICRMLVSRMVHFLLL